MKLPYRPLWYRPVNFNTILSLVFLLFVLPLIVYIIREHKDLLFTIFCALTPIFWIIQDAITSEKDLKRLDWHCVHLDQKEIYIRHDIKRTKKSFTWQEIAQVRFVKTPVRPGVFHVYGTFYFARRELTEKQWSTLNTPNDEVIDVQVKTESDWKDVMKFIRPYIPDEKWILSPEHAPIQPHEYDEGKLIQIKESARIWTLGQRTLLSDLLSSIVLLIYSITVMTLFGAKFVVMLSIIFVLYFAIFLFVLFRNGLYYKISEEGIKRYALPGIVRAQARWEDIVEAGFLNNRSVYVSTKKTDADIRNKLRFKDGVVAKSASYNPLLAAAFAKHVPVEKWVR